MDAFSCETLATVVAFWQIPSQVLFGQSTFITAVLSGLGPILILTISFSPSGVPQASTKILSISKQVAGIWLNTCMHRQMLIPRIRRGFFSLIFTVAKIVHLP